MAAALGDDGNGGNSGDQNVVASAMNGVGRHSVNIISVLRWRERS